MKLPPVPRVYPISLGLISNNALFWNYFENLLSLTLVHVHALLPPQVSYSFLNLRQVSNVLNIILKCLTLTGEDSGNLEVVWAGEWLK